MTPLDAAKALADDFPERENNFGDLVCAKCWGHVPEHELDCPVPMLPQIVAALEAGAEMARDAFRTEQERAISRLGWDLAVGDPNTLAVIDSMREVGINVVPPCFSRYMGCPSRETESIDEVRSTIVD